MSIELLKALPSVSEIEAKLRTSGTLLADSTTQKVLDRYRAARAALTRTALAASAEAMGVAMAAASEVPAADAARVAKECAEFLQALVK